MARKVVLYQDGQLPADAEVTTDAIELAVLSDGKGAVSHDEMIAEKAITLAEGKAAVLGNGMSGEQLRATIGEIKEKSAQIEEIRAQVRAKIREKYSVEDEIYLLRTGVSNEFRAWNDYVEYCRNWGFEKRKELGL